MDGARSTVQVVSFTYMIISWLLKKGLFSYELRTISSIL
jgi:hypothetical protein